MSRTPDFFILGAPKCGTSALDQYLAEHPRIFMCEKELSYFAFDFPNHRITRTFDDYLKLFDSAPADTLAVGEGTFCYLFSREAAAQILALNPRAKVIAMLRNPIDLVHSFHSQLTFNGEENVDLATALQLEPVRRQGQHIPPHCQTAAMLQYTQVAMLGEQVERLYEVFPAENIKLILFDDFRRDVRAVYEDVLEFLGVPTDDRQTFPKVNQNKRHSVAWLGKFTEQPPRGLVAAARLVKRLLGLKTLGVMSRLRKINVREESREPISPALRSYLANVFRDDVEKLSERIGRDLSHWCGRREEELCEVG